MGIGTRRFLRAMILLLRKMKKLNIKANEIPTVTAIWKIIEKVEEIVDYINQKEKEKKDGVN